MTLGAVRAAAGRAGAGRAAAGPAAAGAMRAGRGEPIPSLTGIRGVAAAYVFLTHAQPVLALFLAAPAIDDSLVLRNGFRGVDLFFLLSGFILMHVHHADFLTLERERIRRFLVLRACRVYPVNAAVLALLVPVALLLPGFVAWTRMRGGVPVPWHDHDFSPAGLVQSLLLAQCWSVVKPGQWNGPAWSLSAEVFGYALFPPLAWLAARCRSAALAGLAAAGSLLALCAALLAFGHAQDNPTAAFGLVRMLFCFAGGIALWRCFRCWPAGARVAPGLALASLAWTALCVSLPAFGMLAVFGFAGMILALAYRRGRLDALLSGRTALFLGRISFSFYLVHYALLQLASWLFERWDGAEAPLGLRVAALAATGLLCVLAAMAMQRWVEQPSQRLARALLRRPAAPAASAAPMAPIASAAPVAADAMMAASGASGGN